MRKTVKSMLKKGTTTFVDFREGGLDGVLLMQKVLSNTPIRSIILGRIEYYQSKDPDQKKHTNSTIISKPDRSITKKL